MQYTLDALKLSRIHINNMKMHGKWKGAQVWSSRKMLVAGTGKKEHITAREKGKSRPGQCLSDNH
ncbi:hypothetical protein [Desulfosediminicola sp.]|uniref:hypothetical protein n=1 Tax=Desulfosediminicola sp. TaxID=2886825 RepID=UPI003AF262AC